MANQVSINFLECEPSPSQGYRVMWRVQGTGDPYTDAGNFFTSPAVFNDDTNPNGTQYEGTITAEGIGVNCNPVNWATVPTEESSGSFDNSSCGTMISETTSDQGYIPLPPYTLNVDGAASVSLSWAVQNRPNRFTLYDNGFFSQTSSWHGFAPYPGPWGVSGLNNATTGSINFVPIPGHTYTLLVEVGPGGPPPYDVSDNFQVDVLCS